MIKRIVPIALACILARPGPAAETAAHRSLTFEERVTAQQAIEAVYWNHRIWPKENARPKPPLSAVLSDDAIRARVEDYLKKSNALEALWDRRVTGAQLQAEMNRMAADTRDGKTLAELFAVLGNDPFVIAETLARQTLADRLVRGWYAQDDRFHRETRRRAESAIASCNDPKCMRSMGGAYVETTMRRRHDGSHERITNAPDPHVRVLDSLEWSEQRNLLERAFRAVPGSLLGGTLSPVEETADSFSVTAVLTESADEIRTASVTWPKQPFETWWAGVRATLTRNTSAPSGSFSTVQPSTADCTDDTWRATKAPLEARIGHTAVWTGAEMIVWGGYRYEGSSYIHMKTGSRYNPSTDSWQETASGAVGPEPRSFHTAVWTGTEMIVWGGNNGSGFLNSGGRYNPGTDSWVATSTGAGAPWPRNRHSVVWTGAEMIVWGGYGDGGYAHDTGGRYDPFSDSWIPTSRGANRPAGRWDHVAVWTGTEMIVWGGYREAPDYRPLNDGARYDPATDTWVATSLTNAPAARTYHTAVWTGDEMVVWGGYGGAYLNTGGRYDPSTDSWATTSTGANAPEGRIDHTAVWTGTEMIVWGGYFYQGTDHYLNSGGRYDPSTDSWLPTATGANVPAPRRSHTAIWTGTEMIAWGGGGTGVLFTGGRYNPSTGSWIATATEPRFPSPRGGHTAVWTGTEMIVWGIASGGSGNTGDRYVPATDSWMPISTGATTPASRWGNTVVWTGTEMIVWGGVLNGVWSNSGDRYNPTSDSWTATALGGNVPYARVDHTAIWTGTEMIVWGGYHGDFPLSSGGRYRPSTDSWLPTMYENAPAPRYGHTAVWTGNEMIIWGGHDERYALSSGGRYNPVADSWGYTTWTSAPAARSAHTAVWTGSEMIVWGGDDGDHGYHASGGRYSPSSDTWWPTPVGENAPSARVEHTAVWTGNEMIIWGGYAGGEYSNSGGRYNPSTNFWIPTSSAGNVPLARTQHTAVWTGTEMIVWGGYGEITLDSGARYCATTCDWPTQYWRDADADTYGNSTITGYACYQPPGFASNNLDCNDVNPSMHPGATEICNHRDDDCDGDVDESGAGVDVDGDGAHDVCDNCAVTWNPSQSDFDHDGEGDLCDFDDGLIYVLGTSDKSVIEWQPEQGPAAWNVHEGDLAVLRTTGSYTQATGSNPLAEKHCDLAEPRIVDRDVPASGAVKFSLVTGTVGGAEGSLGTNSAGVVRPNTDPCP